MPKLADAETCTSLAEYWTRGANRFRLYIRCEAGADHQGKHRNKHGKSWRTEEEIGRLDPALQIEIERQLVREPGEPCPGCKAGPKEWCRDGCNYIDLGDSR